MRRREGPAWLVGRREGEHPFSSTRRAAHIGISKGDKMGLLSLPSTQDSIRRESARPGSPSPPDSIKAQALIVPRLGPISHVSIKPLNVNHHLQATLKGESKAKLMFRTNPRTAVRNGKPFCRGLRSSAVQCHQLFAAFGMSSNRSNGRPCATVCRRKAPVEECFIGGTWRLHHSGGWRWKISPIVAFSSSSLMIGSILQQLHQGRRQTGLELVYASPPPLM